MGTFAEDTVLDVSLETDDGYPIFVSLETLRSNDTVLNVSLGILNDGDRKLVSSLEVLSDEEVLYPDVDTPEGIPKVWESGDVDSAELLCRRVANVAVSRLESGLELAFNV